MDKFLYNTFDSYFHALEKTGYVKQTSVNALLVLDFLFNLMYKDYRGYISKEDYHIIDKAINCLYGVNCLIPYPDYLKMGKLHLGEMTEVLSRTKSLEEYSEELDKRILDNDVLIADNTRRIDENESRLNVAESRLDAHDVRLENAESTIISHTESLNTIGSVLDTHESRLNGHDTQLAGLDQRITTNEGNIANHEGRLDTLEAEKIIKKNKDIRSIGDITIPDIDIDIP